jgi:hypothetical protein
MKGNRARTIIAETCSARNSHKHLTYNDRILAQLSDDDMQKLNDQMLVGKFPDLGALLVDIAMGDKAK